MPADAPFPGALHFAIWGIIMKDIKGLLHGHFETGTEGTIPAIMMYEHISEDGSSWSYEGLHIVEPGDHLIVLKNGEEILDVVLDDYITSWDADDSTILADEPDLVAKWKRDPLNPIYGQLHINGFWVHWLPKNVDLRLWWDIFFEYPHKYDGILIKKENDQQEE
jgi:hypothetical protein